MDELLRLGIADEEEPTTEGEPGAGGAGAAASGSA